MRLGGIRELNDRKNARCGQHQDNTWCQLKDVNPACKNCAVTSGNPQHCEVFCPEGLSSVDRKAKGLSCGFFPYSAEFDCNRSILL